MKTKEELKALKEEVETLSEKLHKLTEEELDKVAGGAQKDAIPYDQLVQGQSVWAYDSKLGAKRWGTVESVNSCYVMVAFGGGTAFTKDGPVALEKHSEAVLYVYASQLEDPNGY